MSAVSETPAGEPSRRAATEEEARALASAVRLRILRLTRREALTNNEIAHQLGRNPASVLHHVRRLVDTGFLEAAEERRGPRGSREVPYRSTGKSWTLYLGTGMSESERRQDSVASLDSFLEDVRAVDPATLATTFLGLRLTPEERAEFDTRLSALFDEYRDRDLAIDPTGRDEYEIFLFVYPRPTPGG